FGAYAGEAPQTPLVDAAPPACLGGENRTPYPATHRGALAEKDSRGNGLSASPGHLEAVGCLREAPAGKSLLDGFGKPMPASRPHHPNPETRTRQSPGRRWAGKNRGHVGERARSRLLSGKDGAVMDMETLRKLNELKLLGMADKLRERSEGKEVRELAPGDVVAQLVDCEYERRRNNRVSALLKAAQIRIPSACLEDIEYSIARNLRKETIRELSSCEFIDK